MFKVCTSVQDHVRLNYRAKICSLFVEDSIKHKLLCPCFLAISHPPSRKTIFINVLSQHHCLLFTHELPWKHNNENDCLLILNVVLKVESVRCFVVAAVGL